MGQYPETESDGRRWIGRLEVQVIWLEFGVEEKRSLLVGPLRDVCAQNVPILVLCRVDILRSLFVVHEVGPQEEPQEDASALREVPAAFVDY